MTSKPQVATPAAPVSLQGAALKGSPAAKVAVIEYSDFQCPFCARFARETLPQVRKRYVDTGQLLVAFKHLPLERLHPLAMRAAQAAECAGRGGKFWEMHDKLFENQIGTDQDALLRSGGAIGLDLSTLVACLQGQPDAKIGQDIEEAKALAIRGAPTFMFGTVQSDGRVKITKVVSGALSIDEFANIVDPLLRPGR
jgi:protein-disulfide isomerase